MVATHSPYPMVSRPTTPTIPKSKRAAHSPLVSRPTQPKPKPQRAADQLEDTLCREGLPATTIHGDRSQREREAALASFKAGRTPVMVATDVAARGLDVPNVTNVVNYDMPSAIDDYVHRIGRTGRAGKKGSALSFVNDRSRGLVRQLYELLQENNQEVRIRLDEGRSRMNRQEQSIPQQ